MGIPGIPEDGRSFGAVFREIMRAGLGRTAEQRSERRDWSRADLAHALGWDPKTVGNWLNDKVFPSDRNMDELAALCSRTEPDDHPLLVELRAAREALRLEQAQREAPDAPTTLPPRPDRFGRGPELDALLEALAAPRPAILLTGPPGIGKSHLSLQALHDPASAERYAARRWFVRLDGATTAAAIYPEIARTLGIDAKGGLDAAVDARLAAAPGLLVLDNAETPWWPEPRATEAVLARLAAIEPLALVVSIRGDKAPPDPRWTRTIPVQALGDKDASDLFNAQTGNRFRDDPDLAGLLADMDGVPLAIELLAKAIGTSETDLARIRRRWQDRRTTLLAARRGAEGRPESWEISLRLSLDQLGAGSPEQRLFALMGHLPDGVAEDHLDALLGEGGIDAADRLAELALVREQAARYRMLAPVRTFAADHCPPDPADDHRRLAHYQGLAALGEQVGAEGGAMASRRLEADLRNIETAIADGLDAPDPTPAIEAAIRLRNFIRFTGLATDHLLRVADAHAAADQSPGLRAECAFALALIALHRSDHAAASDHFERAMPLYRKVGDVLGEANCIQSLGNIALARSDHAAARDHYERAMRLYQKVGDVLGEANCIHSLGNIALARSDHAAARGHYERAMPLYRKVGDVLGVANCIKSLGDIALRRSDHAAAREHYARALPLYRKVGSVLGEANCIWGLGDIALARSDHEAARDHFERAMPLYRKVGAVLGEANCIRSLGDIALRRSDHAAAREHYERAMPLYRKVGDVLGVANGIRSLGEVAAAEGATAEAVRLIDEALDLYARIPEPYSMGLARYHLAKLTTGAERAGHLAEARRLWEPLALPHLLAALDKLADEPEPDDP
jgi:tetratricopeptide (TPR) repeat protein/transcriptional regulator with XRE-family HTH domain